MSTSVPFIERETGAPDTSQILREAFPLVGLVVLFGGLALIPFLFVFMVAGNPLLGLLFILLTQLILAVGAGISSPARYSSPTRDADTPIADA